MDRLSGIRAAVCVAALTLGATAAWAQSETPAPPTSSWALELGGELSALLGTGTSSGTDAYWGTNLRLVRTGSSAYRPFRPGHSLCFEEPCHGWTRLRFDAGFDLRYGRIREYQGESEPGEWDGIDNYRPAGTAHGLAAFARGYLEGSTPMGGARAGIFFEGRVGTLRMPASYSAGQVSPVTEHSNDRTTTFTGDLRLGAEIGTESVFTSFGLGGGVILGGESSRTWNISMFLALGLRG